MNRIFVFMLVIAEAYLVCGQLFGNVDPKTLPATLKNKDLMTNYGNCITATLERSKVICDKPGTKLREKIPEAIKLGKCPGTCTPEEEGWLVYIIINLEKQHKEVFDKIIEHFKVTPEQLKKMREYTAKTPLPAGVSR